VIEQLFADRNVEPLAEEENSRPTPAVAFFYFDCTKPECQSVEMALRRIILQLSAHSPDPNRILDEQYKSSNGQKLPNYKDLHRILQKLLREVGRTYIVLDALDECNDFDQAIDLISTLRKWSETPLHLLMGSQTRQSFTKAFKGTPRIDVNFDVTQEDIKLFVADEIRSKSQLKIWRSQVDRVTELVARKSNGM
jgi:hypothetical protein